MNTRRLRIGLVGGGRRGREHLATITELPDLFDLVSVCDLSLDAAASLAKAGNTTPCTDLAEMLDRERPEAIVVATPPEVHHIAAQAAAERGVHMLMETPLGLTRATMDLTIEAAEKGGVIVEVGENMWRRPTERLNRTAIDNGLIGKVLRVTSFYEDAGHDSCYHTMSRLRRYAGADIEEISASSRRFDLDPAVTTPVDGQVVEGPFRTQVLTDERWTQAVLHFANGVVGSCTTITWWTRPLRWAHPHFSSVEGTEGFLSMAGSESNLLRRVRQGVPYTYDRKVDVREVRSAAVPQRYYYATDPQVSYDNPFADRVLTDVDGRGIDEGLARAHELLSLYNAVVHGEAVSYGLAEARRDQELSIMIHEAARLGKPLRALEGETAWEREQHDRIRQQ